MKEYMVVKNYNYAEIYYVNATSSRHAISIVDDVTFDQEPDDIIQDFDFYDADEYRKPFYYDEMMKFANRIIDLDWYYEYSDDHRVWKEGHTNISSIIKDLYDRSASQSDLEHIKTLVKATIMPHDEDERKVVEINRIFTMISDGIEKLESENNG